MPGLHRLRGKARVCKQHSAWTGICALGLVIAFEAHAHAQITGFGSDVVLADPPASILLHQWESSTEIRLWTEATMVLPSDLTLGHGLSGLVDGEGELVGTPVAAGTAISTYMIRVDPEGIIATSYAGHVEFAAPILGVYIGTQLNPLDDLLGRGGIAYNHNDLRGLELDGPGGPSPDSFEISADRMRIDFFFGVDEWTDDIRVVTASFDAIVETGGSCVPTYPPASIALDAWQSSTEIRCWRERWFTLTTPLMCDHVDTGTVDSAGQLVPGTIPAGVDIACYLLRVDADDAFPATLSGYVVLDSPIVGVLIGPSLTLIDGACGLPGIAYNQNLDRGLELDGTAGAADGFTISADRRRIDVAMEVGAGTDDIRIITEQPALFIRGDANGDGALAVSDAVTMLAYLFATAGGPPVACLDAVDANDDGATDIADAVFLLEFLFLSGSAAPPPYPYPGVDPTADMLGCGL